MSTEDRLQTRIAEREALLQRATKALQADARVVAAWLVGSLGRGTEDVLSDLDLWVVIADPYYPYVAAGTREYAQKLGNPLLLLEAPQNAPPNGAYLHALYSGEAGLYQVDWYWQPQSRARIPQEVRLLFDRAGMLSSDLPPTETAFGPRTHQERAKAATERANFFWAMLPLAAKKIARREPWEALSMTQMVRRALAEVEHFTGEETDRAAHAASLPPVQPQEQLEQLRQLARAMEAITPRLAAIGGSAPSAAVPEVYGFFDLVEAMLHERANALS